VTSDICGQATPISQRVLQTVAEETGKSPADLQEPLHNAIDPDALNAMYSRDRIPNQLTFAYNGYQIQIDNGDVEISNSRE